jgi:hypothetical protein
VQLTETKLMHTSTLMCCARLQSSQMLLVKKRRLYLSEESSDSEDEGFISEHDDVYDLDSSDSSVDDTTSVENGTDTDKREQRGTEVDTCVNSWEEREPSGDDDGFISENDDLFWMKPKYNSDAESKSYCGGMIDRECEEADSDDPCSEEEE